MSTPPDQLPEEPSERTHLLRVVLRGLALVCAAISLVVLWTGERVRVRDDLQLVVAPSVRPGDPLPVRAFVFRDVEAPAGPTLARTPVTVRLRDPEGRELAHTQLSAAALDTMEGVLRVPGNARGTLLVSATADENGDLPLICQRAIDVTPDAPPLPLLGRAAGPLQQLALAETQPLGLSAPPAPFLPRVLGGACVPEQRCSVLVWVGEPAAAVSVQPNPAITLLGQPLPAGETAGLVELSLRVHGLEAELVLLASRGNEPVARRALRLPIGLGDVAVYAAHALLDEGESAQLALALPPGRQHAILDVFSDGHAFASRTIADVLAEQPLAGEIFPPGLSRVQARVDRFSAEGAGSRMLYVRRAGERTPELLANLVRAAARAPGDDGAVAAWVNPERGPPAWLESDLDRAVAFVLAPLEALRVQVPDAVSGRPAQLARVEGAKRFARFAVSGLLVLAALVVGVSLARRGLVADQEAGLILAEAEDAAHSEPPAERRTGTMWVITLTAAVVLAFLTGALLIASKSLWF